LNHNGKKIFGVTAMLDSWMLIGTIERCADVVRTKSEEEQDIVAKAYKAGKADGLSMASDLFRTINRNGHVNESGKVENLVVDGV